MRVLLANVSGINSKQKMHYFFSLAKRMNAMVTFFQEVKLKHEDLNNILKSSNGAILRVSVFSLKIQSISRFFSPFKNS